MRLILDLVIVLGQGTKPPLTLGPSYIYVKEITLSKRCLREFITSSYTTLEE